MCARGVDANSVLCTDCGDGYISAALTCKISCTPKITTVYPTCEQPDGWDGMEQKHISLGLGSENVTEEVETFTYLSDVVVG